MFRTDANAILNNLIFQENESPNEQPIVNEEMGTSNQQIHEDVRTIRAELTQNYIELCRLQFEINMIFLKMAKLKNDFILESDQSAKEKVNNKCIIKLKVIAILFIHYIFSI